MIKIKIKDLLNGETALAKVKSVLDNEGFDFSLGYKLTRLINKVSSELQEIYRQREKFLNKYGEEDKDNPGIFRVKDEYAEKAQKVWDKFIETEIEISGVNKLTEEEVAAIGKLTTTEIIGIAPFTTVDMIDLTQTLETHVPSIDELEKDNDAFNE